MRTYMHEQLYIYIYLCNFENIFIFLICLFSDIKIK